MSSFVAYSTFIHTTSFTATSNQATSSWVSAIRRTWYTSLISDYQRNFGTPIHACISHTTRALDSQGWPPSRLLIVTWARSLGGEMIWSPSLISYFTFSGVFYHGRAWEKGWPFFPENAKSPRTSCSWPSQRSFTLSLNTAARSLLTKNQITTIFTTFSAMPYCGKGLKSMWHLIGTTPAAKTNRVVWIRVPFSTNAIVLPNVLHGKHPTHIVSIPLHSDIVCMQIALSGGHLALVHVAKVAHACRF